MSSGATKCQVGRMTCVRSMPIRKGLLYACVCGVPQAHSDRPFRAWIILGLDRAQVFHYIDGFFKGLVGEMLVAEPPAREAKIWS